MQLATDTGSIIVNTAWDIAIFQDNPGRETRNNLYCHRRPRGNERYDNYFYTVEIKGDADKPEVFYQLIDVNKAAEFIAERKDEFSAIELGVLKQTYGINVFQC